MIKITFTWGHVRDLPDRRQTESAKPPAMICGDCDREETDAIMLDVERCAVCGELLSVDEDANDR